MAQHENAGWPFSKDHGEAVFGSQVPPCEVEMGHVGPKVPHDQNYVNDGHVVWSATHNNIYIYTYNIYIYIYNINIYIYIFFFSIHAVDTGIDHVSTDAGFRNHPQ